MISEEMLQEALKSTLPSVLEGLKQSFKERAIRDAENKMSQVISETVATFMKEEIVPEIQRSLIESKEGLIATVPLFAGEITTLLAEAMTKELKKKLETSWDRQKIFEAMFK